MFFALEDRQAIVMRADAAFEDFIAVVQQVVRGNGSRDRVVGSCHILRGILGGDVFKHDRVDKTGSYIPQSVFQEPDLIIGADFFRAHRIFLANSQGKLYFTYSGGPIFAPPQRRVASPTTPATLPPPPATDVPQAPASP